MSVHPTAIIDPRAKIAQTANIGPFVVIDGPAEIGERTTIGPSSVILGQTRIGEGCQIHAHVVLGDLPQDRAYTGQESFCEIGDETIIREGATVHRGTTPGSSTIVGKRCFLMTNSHIGHNCVVADDVTLVTGAVLGGHAHIGWRAVLGGNSAVHQFVHVGDFAMIGGLARVTQHVPPYFMTDGDGAVIGVNLVGLKRAGFTSEQRDEIRKAFRVLYRSGYSLADARLVIMNTISKDVSERLVEFLASPAITPNRGIAKTSLRKAA